MLAFYDVHADCLVGQVRKRKTVDDLMAVFARLRSCYPITTRLYVVMEHADSQPTVPLGMIVRASGHGEADVLVAAPSANGAALGLRGGPLAAVADDLSDLPSLVERALA